MVVSRLAFSFWVSWAFSVQLCTACIRSLRFFKLCAISQLSGARWATGSYTAVLQITRVGRGCKSSSNSSTARAFSSICNAFCVLSLREELCKSWRRKLTVIGCCGGICFCSYLNWCWFAEISQETAVNPVDIVSTLQALQMLKYWKGKHLVLKRQVRFVMVLFCIFVSLHLAVRFMWTCWNQYFLCIVLGFPAFSF